MITLDELKIALQHAYTKNTAHYKWKSRWTKENPTCGQCVPTALLVQHYFGGDIYKHKIESHYFNIIDGVVIDLTADQFTYKLDYTLSKPSQPNLAQSKTLERYQLLKERVEKYLIEKNEI